MNNDDIQKLETEKKNMIFEYRKKELKEVDVPYIKVKFQDGPVKEVGVNGCQTEDLIDICIRRIEIFQDGPFKCEENKLALEYLRIALFWLEKRTKNRIKQGVEGQDFNHAS